MKNVTFKRTLSAVAVAAAISVSSSAFAQDTTGAIRGDVTSQTQSAIAGATITISNPETGFARSVVVDESGNFAFRNLATGVYTVTIEKAGYATETVE